MRFQGFEKDWNRGTQGRAEESSDEQSPNTLGCLYLRHSVVSTFVWSISRCAPNGFIQSRVEQTE